MLKVESENEVKGRRIDLPSLERVELGENCFHECNDVSFSSFVSSLLSRIDLPHLTSLLFGTGACFGETHGYLFRDDLDEVNRDSVLVMESGILLLG